MVTINFNFNNFSELPTFLEVFGSFDNNYEYTAEGIFRRKAPPFCPRSVLHQLDQKIIYPHYDFKHLTEKYFEIGMKLDDFLIQLVKY